MVKMESAGERVNLEFNMPSRGIIGLRTNVLTASAGEAIMAHRFKNTNPIRVKSNAVPTVPSLPWSRVQPLPMPSINCRIAVSSSSSRRKKCMPDRL